MGKQSYATQPPFAKRQRAEAVRSHDELRAELGPEPSVPSGKPRAILAGHPWSSPGHLPYSANMDTMTLSIEVLTLLSS